MTNYQRFKSIDEALNAYEDECGKVDPWCSDRYYEFFNWLNYEVKDGKVAPCPFCGGECTVEEVCTNEHHEDNYWYVGCVNDECGYISGNVKGRANAIIAHNRLAKR